MSVSTSNRTCNKTLLEIWQKKENNDYPYKLSEDIFVFYIHYLYKQLFMSKIIKS